MVRLSSQQSLGQDETACVNMGIGIITIACLLSCYFAACYTALKTFSKSKFNELLEKQGHTQYGEPFLAKVSSMVLMTATLRSLFNFMILLGSLHVVEQLKLGKLPEYAIAFVVAAVLVAVFGVAIPASWARYHPEVLVVRSMRLLGVLLKAFYPFIAGLHALDPIVRRISGADLEDHTDADITEEVLSVVEEHDSQGNVNTTQKQMIEAVFDLPSTTAGEIMTPRTEVSGIPIKASLEEIKANILTHGHSRIPIYDQNIDHIVGMLYSKDLITYLGNEKPFDLRTVLREVLMVPESKPVAELLAEFRARKVHIAVVLDEYGGTAGLVSIEDILEELVGEIQDEHEADEDSPSITKTNEYTFEADARVYMDDLNDQLALELPEDEDYDTLGGFVFSTLGHIPVAGESFEFHGLKFTVTDALKTKVNKVLIQKPAPATTDQAEAS